MKPQTLYINSIDDSALWSNLKLGDEKSFSLLFKRFYPNLVQYGNTLSSSREKVQDCVQDVFTDLWVYRKSLNDAVVVKSYLLSCVRKRISRLQERDHIFRQSSSIDLTKFLFEFSIEHQLIADEITAKKVSHLNKLLNDLPARQKEALYIRYHQGLTLEQTADILHVNYQSANNLLHRALLNLRKEWKGKTPFILSLMFFICCFF